MLSQINYTIGDEIVAIQNHSTNQFKIGDVFICKQLKFSDCKCQDIIVDIGHRMENSQNICLECNYLFGQNNTIFYKASRFVKLDSLHDISEITKILENTI